MSAAEDLSSAEGASGWLEPSYGEALVDAALHRLASYKPTISDMQEIADREAARIYLVQAGLIDCGARTKPDEGQIKALIGWRALGRLALLFARHEERARTFFRDLEQGRRG